MTTKPPAKKRGPDPKPASKMEVRRDEAARPRIGPALRALRESTGLGLREFCQRAGFDHAFVSRVERDVFRPKASWIECFVETAGEALAEQQSDAVTK